MPRFEKGHKFVGKGGRQANQTGRPTKLQTETKKIAAALALKYLEDHLKPVLDTYIMMALGTGPRGGKLRKGMKLTPAITMHYVERFVPPAPKQIDLGLTETMEDFVASVQSGSIFDDVEDAEIVAEKSAIEDKRTDDDVTEK